MPLVATWCVTNEALGDYCHASFELDDESTIALFQFADDARYEAFRRPQSLSDFHHVALAGSPELQEQIRRRADAHSVRHSTIDHGYVVSLYLKDPDEHMVEVTYDTQVALDNATMIRRRAGDELERWLAGDHTANNELR